MKKSGAQSRSFEPQSVIAPLKIVFLLRSLLRSKLRVRREAKLNPPEPPQETLGQETNKTNADDTTQEEERKNSNG